MRGGIEGEERLDIFGLSDWFLAKSEMTHKKLQKICYYAVAWGYALMGRQLFDDDEFQAWVHGPVSKKLYDRYKVWGWNMIEQSAESPKVADDILELLESVWETYGDKDGNELEALSHSEKPWREARVGLEEDERGDSVIKVESMKAYYRSIYSGDL